MITFNAKTLHFLFIAISLVFQYVHIKLKSLAARFNVMLQSFVILTLGMYLVIFSHCRKKNKLSG